MHQRAFNSDDSDGKSDSRNAGKRYDLVVAAMVLIGVIGLLLNLLVQRVSRLRALRWGFRETSA